MKKIFTLISFLLVFTGSILSQGWTNQGGFPNNTFAVNNPGGHAVAVDPDGKIWIGNYYNVTGDTIFNGTSWVATRAIHVYNPDGSEVSFSPIKTITVNGVTDSLIGFTNRGFRTAVDGNILVTSGNRLYKINYQTGVGMAKVIPDAVNSGTAPAVDAAGNVYIATVAPGHPIKIYSPDLSLYLGNVIDASVGFSRSFEVSADGNKVYWAGYTNHKIYVYSRPDEFSPYALSDSVLFGFDCESFTWSPDRTLLWASAGSYNDRPNQDGAHITSWTPGTWYAWNPVTNQMVDSINTVFTTPNDPNLRPRALGFSSNYLNAYVAYFGSSMPTFQKFTKPAATNIPVTFQLDMSVMVAEGTFNPATQSVTVRGNFQAAAGDPGGDWQGTYFTMTAGANNVYTTVATFPANLAGTNYEFKFVKMPGDGWESVANRTFTLTGPSMTLPKVYFNDDDVINTSVVNTIVFTADINGILNIGAGGAFDPNQDSLLVMGLDWEGGTNVVGARRMVNENPFNSGEYTTTLSVQSTGTQTKWKFKAFPDSRFSNSGWELGTDRWYTYGPNGTTTTLLSIIPGIFPLFPPLPTDVDITFNVDMTNAVNRYNGLPIPLSELQFVGLRGGADFLGNWASGCWCLTDTTSGNMKVLTHISGNTWSYHTVVPAGTNGGNFEYKFAAIYPGADTVNGGSSPFDNEGGFGENHSFVLSGAQPTIVINKIFNDFTDVKIVDDQIPNNYVLDQNYPNPFNPSTVIKYSLPEASFVTLKIYNLLGQEVAVLVNNEQSSGVYQATFDASLLSSGVYFYSLQTKNFTATKKMMLMK